MAPHQAERYKIRSGAERANSRLKEDFGANNVMASSCCLRISFCAYLFKYQVVRDQNAMHRRRDAPSKAEY